jgi:hypothetical protein
MFFKFGAVYVSALTSVKPVSMFASWEPQGSPNGRDSIIRLGTSAQIEKTVGSRLWTTSSQRSKSMFASFEPNLRYQKPRMIAAWKFPTPPHSATTSTI